MGLGMVEQICSRSKHGSRYRKRLKVYKARSERRRAKHNPECEPRYNYYRRWQD
jgi:hypothetical protein